MDTNGLLNLVNRLSTFLDLPFGALNCDDIDIQFLEMVLSKLTGFRPHPRLPVEERFAKCLKNVTKVINVPLTHINATDLKNGDATALYHLIEILSFLAEYVRNDVKDIAAISDSSENLGSTNFNRSNGELSTSGSVDSNFDQGMPRAVTPNHHSMLKGSSQSENSFLQTDDEWIDRTDHQKHVFYQGDTKVSRDASAQYLQSNEFDGTRMAYLREKLRECLSSSSLGHNPSLSNTAIPQKNLESNLKRTSSNTQTVTRAASAATFRKRPLCGVVKSNDRPLVRFARNHDFREPHTTRGKRMSNDPPDSLLDCVLEAFPKLELDSHDRRLFRRKAGKFNH
ncbi:hypothetical protein AHF37_11018 [Paragonimus kellicotti]|nr:hypothetical protein AHF37_11018 [Paragonimus kellicotti]